LSVATIRKRKRAHGYVWVADYLDGARRRHRLTAPTKERAQELLAEKVQEARQALPPSVEDRDVLLSEYATKFKSASTAAGLAKATQDNYAEMLERYILPILGAKGDERLPGSLSLKVREIHRAHVKALIGRWGQAGLSKNTLRLIRAVLSSLLTEAVEDGIIIGNPALALFRKKKAAHQLSLSEQQARIRPFTDVHLRTFLTIAMREEPGAYPYWMLLALGGLRPSEGLGIQWVNFDFAAREIHVERTIQKDGTPKPPKDGEPRTVDMHAALIPVFRRLERSRKEALLREGGSWNESAYIFATRTGRPWDLANVGRAFRHVLKAAELPHHRPYDLRHTYATSLLADGVPITHVASQLGHANPVTTLRHYAHWIPKEGKRYVDRLLTEWPNRGRDGTDLAPVAGEAR
jgi:integrase